MMGDRLLSIVYLSELNQQFIAFINFYLNLELIAW